MESYLSVADDRTCVWIDVLAINQHSSSPENAADVAAFESVLQGCTGGTIVVIDMAKCNPATRSWCLYEWDHTLLYHGPDGLHVTVRVTWVRVTCSSSFVNIMHI